jgi:antitoxin VapB
VRIPREFQLPGDEALLTKEGNRLVLEPVARPSLQALLASWKPLDVELPQIDDPAPDADDDPFP